MSHDVPITPPREEPRRALPSWGSFTLGAAASMLLAVLLLTQLNEAHGGIRGVEPRLSNGDGDGGVSRVAQGVPPSGHDTAAALATRQRDAAKAARAAAIAASSAEKVAAKAANREAKVARKAAALASTASRPGTQAFQGGAGALSAASPTTRLHSPFLPLSHRHTATVGESGERASDTGPKQPAAEADAEAGTTSSYSLEDRKRLFGMRLGTFTSYEDEPQDRDRLGGSLPTWLAEAVAEGRVMEAVARVKAMVRTLVMGQGTSVLAREMGPAVDTYPSVLRFNRFEIRGFERYVGTKTNTWVVNNIDIRKGAPPPAMKMLRSIDEVRVIVPSQRSSGRVRDSTKGLRVKKLKILMFDADATSRWRKQLNFTGRYFSTGMVTLIKMYGQAPIGIYGFDFAKGSHGHYFAQLSADTCHDVAGEGFVFQQLQRDGVVVPLPCLEAASAEEALAECALMRLVPPANKYKKGCHKNPKGERLDLSPEERARMEVLGQAGLPQPIVMQRRQKPNQRLLDKSWMRKHSRAPGPAPAARY